MNTEIVNKITQIFSKKYKSNPILIFSPGRINLIGEHTDYNDGFVFPAAIDKGIYTAIQKSNSEVCSVYAYDKKETYQFSLNNIQPIVDGGWRNYIVGVVAEIQNIGIEVKPFTIVFGGDIPVGSGLSSSAALENSVAFGLNELFKLGLSKEEMIFISQRAEHNYVGVKCGIMDQYASMFGKKNNFLLLDCRTIEATPFYIDFKDYELLLINTNVKHSLSDSAYNDRRFVCEKIASMLHVNSLRDVNEEELLRIKGEISAEDYQKALYVIQEIERTLKASKAISDNNIFELGNLIFASHNGLQNQYKVSCDELDFLVDKAKETPDVIGARMMGGGFGGCTINIIKKGQVAKFLEKVAPQYKEKYAIEISSISVAISDGTSKIEM